MYAGNIHHQSPSYIKIQCVFISLSTSVKKNTATMYSFTKTSSTSPALVGTPSQYTLTDQTNYVHFFWALDRGNTFGKLEMMIVIQVQTLSWQFAEATKGARLMHPGYEQQNGRCWSESNFAIYPKDSFWGCFFCSILSGNVSEMDGNLWSSHLDPTFACLVPVEEPGFFDLILKVKILWNLRMMFPAVWCLVISTLSGDY